MSVSCTFGPILILRYFVTLVLSGLSCWSFSGWVDHSVCLPDVPACLAVEIWLALKTPRGNLNWFVLADCLILSVSLLLFLSLVMSRPLCVVSSLTLMPFFLLVSIFPSKERNRNIKDDGRHSYTAGFPRLLLQSVFVQVCMAVDGKQRFLQRSSYGTRQEAQTKTLKRSGNVSEVSVRSMWSIGANDCLESVCITWWVKDKCMTSLHLTCFPQCKGMYRN